MSHHGNQLNTNYIGRGEAPPSRGGSNHADSARAKPIGRPQDRTAGLLPGEESPQISMESGHVNRFLKGIPIPGLEILGGNFQAHQTRHPPRDIDNGNRARRRNGVHQVINLGHKNGDWTQPGELWGLR